MSKIGSYNLELQEQANELGFSTVQEALDNGYEVDGDALIKIDGQAEAHEAWLKERARTVSNLSAVAAFLGQMYESSSLDAHWKRDYLRMSRSVKSAIEFIEKGEM